MNSNRKLQVANWASAVFSLLLIPISAVASQLPTAEPETVGLSSERLDRITRFIRDRIESMELPGAVTLVARRGMVSQTILITAAAERADIAPSIG